LTFIEVLAAFGPSSIQRTGRLNGERLVKKAVSGEPSAIRFACGAKPQV
jgi:hypothetical protein